MRAPVPVALTASLVIGLSLAGCGRLAAHRDDQAPAPAATVSSPAPSPSASADLSGVADDLDAADGATTQAGNDLRGADQAAATADQP